MVQRFQLTTLIMVSGGSQFHSLLTFKMRRCGNANKHTLRQFEELASLLIVK